MTRIMSHSYEEVVMGNVIGIDAHKGTLTCSAVDELGREIESISAVNDGRGFAKIERFALRVGATRVGIECSGSYGLALAQHLVAAHLDIKEVPGQLVKQLRRALAKGKDDTLDALLIARVVAREKSLPPPPLKGLPHDLKALVDHREMLLREAGRHRNRAHAMLTQLRPGYWRLVPALTSSRQLGVARRLVEDDPGVRAELLRDALARVGELEGAANVLERQIEALVKTSGTSLTQIVGVAAITAARILAELRDVGRVPDQSAFGALTGTAPVPASSGKTDRWRLNRGGNRQLNRAIHTIALTQISHDPRARAYLERKRETGKSHRDAMRCLKRHLARVVYKKLVADQARLLLT
jgi:transposase